MKRQASRTIIMAVVVGSNEATDVTNYHHEEVTRHILESHAEMKNDRN
jgi:hypothetical protein